MSETNGLKEGMRVKVIYSRYPQFIGKEGIIASFNEGSDGIRAQVDLLDGMSFFPVIENLIKAEASDQNSEGIARG